MSDWKENCAWYESAVFYHIYPLGMCGVEKHQEDYHENGGPRQHFAQMEQLIPHMKRLGITALYIGPCFESEGHGYETIDYYRVDARLGDNAGFRHFVDACHAAEIRVVVDGVFNHSGRRFFAFEELRKHREGSPYRDWYCNVNFGGNNEFNDGFSYEAWHGYNILPRLNLWNRAVRDYLLDVIRFWVKEFDIDGIRLDCADVLNFDFMKEMRQLANTIKPQFWLMGEVIHGDYSRWVNRDMLHSVTNYELHKGLYSGHNDHNYFEIAHTVRRLSGDGGLVREGKLYTFVENHDVNRLINKVKDPAHMKNIYLLAYTLPGIPSIYYGGEFRLSGVQANGSDDAIRPALSLADYAALSEKENDFVEFLAALGRAKDELAALSIGKYEERLLTNRQFAYARIWQEQTVIAAANNDENPANIEIRAQGGEYVDYMTGKKYLCENGKVSVTLAAHNGIILVKGGWEFKGEENGSVEKEEKVPEKESTNVGSNHHFSGVLIKESINTEDILDEIEVYNVRLLKKSDKRPRYWTALYFTADGEDFPQKLSRTIIADPDRGGNWFADFRGGDEKYIVFRDLVLSYRIGDAAAEAAVCEECRKRGIKEEEINWKE